MTSTLLFALVLNILMFLIAFNFKTDKLTDISYAVTFIGIVVFGVLQNSIRVAEYFVAGIVLVWAFRLGAYLLIRINKIGRDKRFDEMRGNFWKFGRFWVLQALTSWIVMLPATFLFQSSRSTSFTKIVVFGILVSLTGIVIEAVADMQKFTFINDTKNKDKWIESGLWKYSRHPNYFGEILMWIGVYMASYSWLSQRDAYIALLGPLFIVVMLIGVSGIPLLEKSADLRWGSNKKYLEYKRKTSVLIPLPVKK